MASVTNNRLERFTVSGELKARVWARIRELLKRKTPSYLILSTAQGGSLKHGLPAPVVRAFSISWLLISSEQSGIMRSQWGKRQRRIRLSSVRY